MSTTQSLVLTVVNLSFFLFLREYLEIEIAPPQERIHEIVDSVVAHGTCFINRMRSVLLVEDLVDSLKVLSSCIEKFKLFTNS